jgi:hypothetical protein
MELIRLLMTVWGPPGAALDYQLISQSIVHERATGYYASVQMLGWNHMALEIPWRSSGPTGGKVWLKMAFLARAASSFSLEWVWMDVAMVSGVKGLGEMSANAMKAETTREKCGVGC